MAASPIFKVYDYEGTYQAACHDMAAAACLVSFYGERSTIRYGHRKVIWTEGIDGTAADSYDSSAFTMSNRIKETA